MSRWDAYTAVCGHLRAGFLGAPSPPDRGVPWESLIELSSQHYVAPALAWCIKDRPDVPADVRKLFAAVLALNGRRNDVLLAALARIVAACNAIGIVPVPLKGAARLIEQSYPAQSIRFMGDIDVLIPAARAADARAALERIGFRTAPDDVAPPEHHHLPVLSDLARGGGVELHTDVLHPSAGGVIPTDWFEAGTRAATWRDLRMRLPDATRSIGHVVAHDQLAHENHRSGKVALRQMLDVAVIRSAHESEIDWAALDARFCATGQGEALATYLAFIESLLGQRAPGLSTPPRAGAVEEFSRYIARGRARRLAAVAAQYAAACRRDPRSVLRLFDVRQWPRRVRVIRAALDRKAPFSFYGYLE